MIIVLFLTHVIFYELMGICCVKIDKHSTIINKLCEDLKNFGYISIVNTLRVVTADTTYHLVSTRNMRIMITWSRNSHTYAWLLKYRTLTNVLRRAANLLHVFLRSVVIYQKTFLWVSKVRQKKNIDVFVSIVKLVELVPYTIWILE